MRARSPAPTASWPCRSKPSRRARSAPPRSTRVAAPVKEVETGCPQLDAGRPRSGSGATRCKIAPSYPAASPDASSASASGASGSSRPRCASKRITRACTATRQPAIAARVAWHGAGEVIPFNRARVQTLREAASRNLTKQSYRDAAGSLGRRIANTGGAQAAAKVIECVVRAL